jgi:hypothetical protein
MTSMDRREFVGLGAAGLIGALAVRGFAGSGRVHRRQSLPRRRSPIFSE